MLRRMKQSSAAEYFGVTQSTVSRWEHGVLGMAPHELRKVAAVLSARPSSDSDRALVRLVQDSPRAVHLICDITHRLLACSSSRAAEFAPPMANLLGHSLWRYATPAIRGAETALEDAGWRDIQMPDAFEFDTGENGSAIVPITRSRCRWTRFLLSDGTAARLVETI